MRTRTEEYDGSSQTDLGPVQPHCVMFVYREDKVKLIIRSSAQSIFSLTRRRMETFRDWTVLDSSDIVPARFEASKIMTKCESLSSFTKDGKRELVALRYAGNF